jgi:replicative DNA helicase
MQDKLIKDFKKIAPLNTTKLERIPPYNIEAEESLLGAMLISRDAIATVSELINEDDFYRGSNKQIYKSIIELYCKGEPADPITVADVLTKKGLLEEIGGKTHIHSLVSNIPLATNADYYANIVRHNSILRKLIYAATEIATMGYEVPEDLNLVVDKSQQLIFDIAQYLNSDTKNSRFSQIKELLTEVYDQAVLLSEKKASVTGIATGFY